MEQIPVPSGLLACLLLIPLRGQETCQKQAGIPHRGRWVKIMLTFRSAVYLVIVLAVCGCTECKDVSKNTSFLGQMKVGELYIIQNSVFAFDFNTGRMFFDKYPCAPGYWLLPPNFLRRGEMMSTPSIEEWAPSMKKEGLMGIVPAGTNITFEKVIYHNYFENDTAYYVFQVNEGSFKGRRFCLNKIMLEGNNRPYRIPDPRFFALQKK